MKRLFISLHLFIVSLACTAQITSIDYIIEYNEDTEYYDCKILVVEGETDTYLSRTQKSASFTVVVPTGLSLSLVENFNPLLNNEKGDSNTPTEWELVHSFIAPEMQSKDDYYNFAPSISPAIASFNTLKEGDIITLFSIEVDTDCKLSVRPLDNTTDSISILDSNFSQSFTLGEKDQVYSGNKLPVDYTQYYDIGISDTSICSENCVTLSPNINCAPDNTYFKWSTGEIADSITVCPNEDAEYSFVYGYLEDEYISDPVFVTISVGDNPSIDFPYDQLCIGNFYTPFNYTKVIVESNDLEIATVDQFGQISPLMTGKVTFKLTNVNSNCITITDSIEINPTPTIISGAPSICIGDQTTLFPSLGGTWVSINEEVAEITNTGIVTGLSEGSTYFVYEAIETGCYSESSLPLIVENCDPTPALECTDAEVICDFDLLDGFSTRMHIEDSGGIQPFVLCPNGGAPHNISWYGILAASGDYSIIINPSNCSGSFTNLDGIQTGIYTSCDFEEAVYCNTNIKMSPISISSDLLTPGKVYYLFIDGGAGSACDYTINIEGDYKSLCNGPCESDIKNNQPWLYTSAGTFNQDYNVTTYSTGSNLISFDDLDHLVFYDSNSGNVFLKQNNGTGILDEETLLFINEDHSLSGQYEIILDDLDGDKLTDILLLENNIELPDGALENRISIYRNNGEKSFSLQFNENVSNTVISQNLTIADFDNDNMKDIAFVSGNTSLKIMNLNSWDELKYTSLPNVTSGYIYHGDFTNNGIMDLATDRDGAFINLGDGVYIPINFLQSEFTLPSFKYFIESSRSIIDHEYFYNVSNSSSATETISINTCGYRAGGDYSGKIFTANINSEDVPSLVIPQEEGFRYLRENFECEQVPNPLSIEEVKAQPNTKIDLNQNGLTDFLIIENGQINAWINPEQINKILGTAYVDRNRNGIYDASEAPLRNTLISIIPGNLSVLTDSAGKYSITVPTGNFFLKAAINDGNWEENLLAIENIEIAQPCNEGYNFGFVPVDQPSEMINLSMVNTIARCDFETQFTITAENVGTEPFTGVLVFEFDDRTTFFSSDIQSSQVDGNKVLATVGPIDPFDPNTYKITVKMPFASSKLPILDFRISLLNQFGATVSEYGYAEQLRCSYDPNDKRAFPDREGDDNLTLFDEDLEYTIRFQNNGNDTAFQVKIVDPLDPNIEPSSIRVVSASHAVETCIEGTDLIFLFEGIQLVDSMTNYPGSQGYVTFKCNVKDGITEFTPVENQAHIIFDTNEPIITNQTLNTFVSFICSNKETNITAEICDGEDYYGFTESGVHTQNFTIAGGCDSLVIIELNVQGITYAQQVLQACEGENVTINGTVFTIMESIDIVDTLYSDIGCISSILTFAIEALPASDPLCTVSTDDLAEEIVDIYPNPATEMLFIDSAKEWSAVKLMNTNGQVVHTLNAVKTGITTIDIQPFSAGVYMLIFDDGNDRWGERVVVR